MKKRRKDLKPSELAALQAEENAAALEALRKRREKEHKKMMRSKGSNKRVGNPGKRCWNFPAPYHHGSVYDLPHLSGSRKLHQARTGSIPYAS